MATRLRDWFANRQIFSAEKQRSSLLQQQIMKFNHHLEIPKLERWMRENPNPKRAKLLQYMQILNSSNFRKRNPKVTYQQICNWFSNARASQRYQTNLWPSLKPIAIAPKVPQSVQKVYSSDIRNVSIDFNRLIERQNVTNTPNGNGVDVKNQTHHHNQIQVKSAAPAQNGLSLTSPLVNGESPAIGQNMDLLAGSLPFTFMQQQTTDSIQSSDGNAGGHSPASSDSQSTQQPTQPQRSRLMFDPISEVPVLERWFEENPHPTWVSNLKTKNRKTYLYGEFR